MVAVPSAEGCVFPPDGGLQMRLGKLGKALCCCFLKKRKAYTAVPTDDFDFDIESPTAQV
jgi:hypothetical protein